MLDALPLWLILALAAAVTLAFYFRPSARAHRRLLALERQALDLVAGPRAQARGTLERHLLEQRERFPQYNRAWHLKRFIAESRRAVR